MARCTVCSHPQRPAVEAAIDAGDSFRVVSERFGFSKSAVTRHQGHRTDGARTGRPTDARARAAKDKPKRHRTHAAEVERTMLEDRAVQLRIAGKNYRQIAAELGSTPGACQSAVERVLIRTRGDADEKADLARAVEVQRCDALIASLWGRATNPACEIVAVPADNEAGVRPYDGQDKAADRIVKVMERRAKLLGLDEPNRVDVTTGGVPLLPGVKPLSEFTDAELEALAERAELPAERPN